MQGPRAGCFPRGPPPFPSPFRCLGSGKREGETGRGAAGPFPRPQVPFPGPAAGSARRTEGPCASPRLREAWEEEEGCGEEEEEEGCGEEEGSLASYSRRRVRGQGAERLCHGGVCGPCVRGGDLQRVKSDFLRQASQGAGCLGDLSYRRSLASSPGGSFVAAACFTAGVRWLACAAPVFV